ncbi:MAG: cytochrome c oxidase assembly protein [Alphaproteobacteria bacterium]|nr:MAG: cytochrome c oxidase assembly protein [Alphaproteobacteria bacterium]
MDNQNKSKRLALTLLFVAGGMVGMAYVAVPLYSMFCRVTGYGGTTQTSNIAPDIVLDRDMTIQFDANTAGEMPWEFKPAQHEIKFKVGQTAMAFFNAYNPTNRTIHGSATFNVTPQKIGQYFTKIDCFCFTEQVLHPGEKASMPVTFFVDPAIDDDPNAKDVSVITLSYTFYQTGAEDDDKMQKPSTTNTADGSQEKQKKPVEVN